MCKPIGSSGASMCGGRYTLGGAFDADQRRGGADNAGAPSLHDAFAYAVAQAKVVGVDNQLSHPILPIAADPCSAINSTPV